VARFALKVGNSSDAQEDSRIGEEVKGSGVFALAQIINQRLPTPFGFPKQKGTYKPKHAMHLIRLLHSGIAALQTGEIRIDVAEHRGELLQIRACDLRFEEVKRRALELDERFQQAFKRTNLPEQPDYRRVDDFLIHARRRMVDA
jgi:hypothetical protein